MTSTPVSFAGKTVTIVVPFTPGGGTDLSARITAKYIANYLPGKPSMIVRNMPGGAGTIGVNYVYRAKPDGITVVFNGGSAPLNQLLGMKAAQYDLRAMPNILSLSTGAVTYVRHGLIEKPEDLARAKGLVYGNTPGGALPLTFLVGKELLNFPMDKIVLGYPGTGDARRAFLAGELNMHTVTTPDWNENVAASAAKGEVLPLFQTGLLDEKGSLIRDPASPPIPTVKELYEKLYGKPPSGIAWDAYNVVVAAGVNFQKTVFLPPGVSESVIREYWKAAESLVKDADFRKIADPLMGDRWSVGEAADKEFKLNYKMDPKLVEWLRATLEKNGVVVE